MSININNATKLLLHGNGANGSQIITDSSIASPKTISVYGNTQNSTTQYKFGTAALKFDGSGDYLSIADTNDFYFGTNDFTIDFWIYFNAKPSNSYDFILCQLETSSRKFYVYFDTRTVNNKNGFNFAYTYNDTEYKLYEGTNAADEYSLSTWYHIMIVKKDGICYIFRDGQLKNSSNFTYSTISNLSAPLLIGKMSGSTAYPNCYLDELRIVNGIGEHTTNFTPPTSEYEFYNILTDCDICLNFTDIVNLPDDNYYDILVNFTDIVNLSEDNDLDIDLNIGYSNKDYQYCSNCDILLDIVPGQYFTGTDILIENGEIVVDPVSQEPIVEEPTEDEYRSCFGLVGVYFQLPDIGETVSVDLDDIIGYNIKPGINQPIQWSLQIVNANRKYTDPSGIYDQLLTENLYIPGKSSRRFIAMVVLSSCGDSFQTKIFPRLIITDISGTEVITLAGIDEISYYLNKRITLNPYCCQGVLDKVVPEGQESTATEFVVTNDYIATSLTNAFNGIISTTNTQVLLNYTANLSFTFDSTNNTFTVSKPIPEPPVFGELPGEIPTYQIEYIPSTGYNMSEGRDYVKIYALDSLGNKIKNPYDTSKYLYLYFIVDPRLPVIVISPLSMQWTIEDICKKVIDLQEGTIVKEYFKVNQFYQDFQYYSDINVLNTEPVSIIKQQCLDSIPGEYTIDSIVDAILYGTCTLYDDSAVPADVWTNSSYSGQNFNIYATYEGFYPDYPIGTTIKTTSPYLSFGYDNGSPYPVYRTTIATIINTALDTSWQPDSSQINSWKLQLNLYDIVLEDEKPAPDYYIQESLIRTEEHQISRSGIEKFNTVRIISPMELGTAQSYPMLIPVYPSENQQTRPVFIKSSGEFLGFSSMCAVDTASNNVFYTSTNLSVAYSVNINAAGQQLVNFGENNVITVNSNSNSPSSCTIYNPDDTYYTLNILWNNPCRK